VSRLGCEERPIFMREVFSPGDFFLLFFPEDERESSCRAVFGASRFCHTRVTFGDVNFSPDSFSFRSTY